MLYRLLVRPWLYLLPAETAHRLVMAGMRMVAAIAPLRALVRALFGTPPPSLAVEALGQRFASPIGLAAGLDKDAEAYEAFGALGFGFVEVGTITAEGQPGNPRPRLFRLVRDRALINRMGFNNLGAEHAARALARAGTRRTKLGINIGKTKLTPNERAEDDYAKSAALLAPFADYMVINVSSPNTPGLRDLQAVEALRPLLVRVRGELDRVRAQPRIPLLLKIAPDLSDADIDAIADLALELKLDGVIATNTTITRDGLASDPAIVSALGAGGLSGAPLKERSLAVLRRLRARVGDRVLLVAVGGIETADDVWLRLRAGATLVQLYTALIYDGPGLPKRVANDLALRVREAGFERVIQIVGLDVAHEANRSSH
jgi:dihydroorotate dehydrogenase